MLSAKLKVQAASFIAGVAPAPALNRGAEVKEAQVVDGLGTKAQRIFIPLCNAFIIKLAL